MYRIFKLCQKLCLNLLIIINNVFQCVISNDKHLKLQLRVFLTCHTVAMVTYHQLCHENGNNVFTKNWAAF